MTSLSSYFPTVQLLQRCFKMASSANSIAVRCDLCPPPSTVAHDAEAGAALSPAAEINIPLALSAFESAEDQQARLSALADAMDVTRAELNRVLTIWKDAIGKELDSNDGRTLESSHHSFATEEGEDDQDEEAEEE